jgi:tetratricopeptide (TPR) repeat protein
MLVAGDLFIEACSPILEVRSSSKKLKPMNTQAWRHRNKSAYSAFFVLVLACLVFRGTSFSAQSNAAKMLAGKAEAAQAKGDTHRALDLYSHALQQMPFWSEGWWRYGGLLYEGHRFKEAGQAFSRLTLLAPKNPLGFALLGLCEYEESDWNNAALHLNKALNQGGLPPEIANAAMYHFGLVLMRQKNRNGALIMFKLLFHQVPGYPNLKLALGSAELGLEQIPPPGSPVFSAVNLAGKSAVAVIELRPKDAEESYRELVAEFPNLPYAHLCLGLFLENGHRDQEAEQEFVAETKVAPNNAAPWIWLAQVALEQNELSIARTAAERARGLNPNDPLCYLIEGRSFILEHQWEKAVPLLQKAEARAPDSSDVHFELAKAYAALHRDQAAENERKLFLQTSSAAKAVEGNTAR